MSEKEFQSQVIALAHLTGWRVYSIPDSRRTTLSGYPDLTLWNPKKKAVLFAELKTDKGRLSAEQITVIDELRECGTQVVVWRPKDWEEIVGTLKKGKQWQE